ncbi:putative Hsc70 cochaperone (SGT) [Aspergillus glaucus CBS 516.65]|uniref:SGTA homodimerisation domain-containing protein n=1 Tax=Aspergillus glaucus CBS 516.65 TaxID=1160497 RepID=A0A1L9VHM5_ASPGL|nr:hypothetical protein ASPGLDRAFT_67092 [Aspergillus glaucus CBS 516.65]OJJ83437.1 hypothetical protein ASPGLDRAFT_67092 [Aspergillus glaucus CBS 516.65]
MAPNDSKKRLALAVVDFLGSSLKDGTLTADDAESIEIAQSCIADTFKVDPSDEAAVKDAVGGQSLANIYSVYEKLRNRPSGDASATASASASSSSAPAPAAEQPTPKPGVPTPDSDRLKAEGNAAMASKDYDGAINFYTQALEISKANPIYLSNRAAAYSASGQHEKAAEDAEYATVADPTYSKAWSRLGLARYDMQDFHGAKEAYEKGIEAEGNGGSSAMKKGLETCKRKIDATQGVESSNAGNEGTRGAGTGAGAGAGGMPDLSSLASMLGGGGGGGGGGMPDLGSMMNNPMFANMAQNLMSNPDALGGIMNNPQLRSMAENFGRGGGMPDMSNLMNDPNIANM